MSSVQQTLLTLSFLAWLIAIGFDLARTQPHPWRSAAFQLAIMAGLMYIFHEFFGYFNSLEVKGGDEIISESWKLAGLYGFTILGIIGQHVFVQTKGLGDKGRQAALKWRPVLKPLIISPIVFLAVTSQLDKMGAQANTLTAVLMQMGLAFQNGFFWQTIFAQRTESTREVNG